LYTNSSNTGVNGSLQNGLVGWWTFDGKDIALRGGKMTAYDKSENGNTASSRAGTPPTRTLGKIGQGLSFPDSE
jgi:hypothetical protein